MIYKLVCAGNDCFINHYHKQDDEFIIAIDGGYNVLNANKITVNAFFGDCDSLQVPNLKVEDIHVFPTKKDDSDFDLVINYLINERKIANNEMIIVYNATGGRLDHYQAILNTLVKYEDYNIQIIDDNNWIFMSDYYNYFYKDNYKYISFYSYNDETLITLKGFKYVLDEYNLQRFENLCLSNEIIEQGELTVNHKVLVIKSN